MKCKICEHPQRARLDGALLLGKPFRVIAKEFGVARSTLHTHSKHIRGGIERAAARVTIAYSRKLCSYVNQLQDEMLKVCQSARVEGNLQAAIDAAKAGREIAETGRKLLLKTPVEKAKGRPGVPEIVVEYEGAHV